MRTTLICVALTLFVGSAVAQPPNMKLFTSSSDVQALIAKAKKERKPDQPVFAQPLLTLAPYNVSLEYRGLVGPASVHEKEAEAFYVIEGGATLITGGKLLGEKRTNAENLTGTGIEGGESREVSKGDFFIVPEGVPHWFGKIPTVLIQMSFHVPRPVGK